jgi:hypothetical protein
MGTYRVCFCIVEERVPQQYQTLQILWREVVQQHVLPLLAQGRHVAHEQAKTSKGCNQDTYAYSDRAPRLGPELRSIAVVPCGAHLDP